MKQGTWVLFDLDGTLTESGEGIANCARYTAERMGLPVPEPAVLRKFVGPPLFWSFQEYMGLSAEDAEKAIEIYRERYNTIGLFENRSKGSTGILLVGRKSYGNNNLSCSYIFFYLAIKIRNQRASVFKVAAFKDCNKFIAANSKDWAVL